MHCYSTLHNCDRVQPVMWTVIKHLYHTWQWICVYTKCSDRVSNRSRWLIKHSPMVRVLSSDLDRYWPHPRTLYCIFTANFDTIVRQSCTNTKCALYINYFLSFKSHKESYFSIYIRYLQLWAQDINCFIQQWEDYMHVHAICAKVVFSTLPTQSDLGRG